MSIFERSFTKEELEKYSFAELAKIARQGADIELQQKRLTRQQEAEQGKQELRRVFSHLSEEELNFLCDTKKYEAYGELSDVASEQSQLLSEVKAHEDEFTCRYNVGDYRRVRETIKAKMAAKPLTPLDAMAVAEAGYDFLNLKEYRLQRTEMSRMHTLPNLDIISKVPYEPYLIVHDWAAAFANDPEFLDGTSTYTLPAARCGFEFRISGHYVMAVSHSTKNKTLELAIAPPKSALLTERIRRMARLTGFPLPDLERMWWQPCVSHVENISGAAKYIEERYAQEFASLKILHRMITQTVKAACIALDAGLAEATFNKTPEKLNQARIKRGKVPLPDYHVIDLARGVRERHQSPRGEYQGVVRFHLRREHMRHYSDGKNVRVKWCLVGNPDLGFIDHVYRL